MSLRVYITHLQTALRSRLSYLNIIGNKIAIDYLYEVVLNLDAVIVVVHNWMQ